MRLSAPWLRGTLALGHLGINGLFERQRLPTKAVDVSVLAEVMLELDHDSFVELAGLRPTPELLDELDLDFRLHWTTIEARQQKQPPPSGYSVTHRVQPFGRQVRSMRR